MQETTESLALALSHHQAGQLAEAKTLYQEILRAEPGHPDALHFLGLLACQVSQHQVGLALIEQSIAASPNPNPVYFNNFGNMLREQGRLAEAIAGYQRAVALKPDYPEAHNNLGNALREAKQPGASMQSCAQAIALRPGYAEAYNNLGNALQDLGELEAAAASYGKAIGIRPEYAEAHNNLGNVLRAQDKLDEAVDAYRKAVALRPDMRVAHHSLGLVLRARGDLAGALDSLRAALDTTDANAHNSLGCVLRDTGDLDGAITHYRQAVELDPELALAHSNLGGVLRRKGRFEEAVRSCTRAIELAPEFAEAYSNLGNTYCDLKKFEAAILSHRHAIDLDPDSADAHHNLAVALFMDSRPHEALASCRKALSMMDNSPLMHISLGDILRALGDLEGGIDAYRKALRLAPHMQAGYHGLIFSLASSAQFSPETMIADARQFDQLMTARARPYRHTASHDGGRLKVGFVSGDLRSHPVGAFLESVVTHLDPARVELVAYATQDQEDVTTARLKPHFAAWHNVTDMSDKAAASRIHADGIDILIDLSGHTKHNRLAVFAWKPAPVQVSWLGFFATTGVGAIDYILGDRHVLPVEEESHFVERPWRLPDSYLCFTPPQPEIAVGPLPMLENGMVTFGCLNNINKIGDAVVALWSRVLHAVPGSRLLLKAAQLGQPAIRDAMTARFAAHGIDAARLLLVGQTMRIAHLETFNQVDIALDPFPYPGGTTSVEGSWMGVPVLTRRGDRFLSHVGESILHTLGMPAWIAADDDDYVSKAVAFAGDAACLSELRASLRGKLLASPLCDAPRFARNLEDAFSNMWAAYIATAPAV